MVKMACERDDSMFMRVSPEIIGKSTSFSVLCALLKILFELIFRGDGELLDIFDKDTPFWWLSHLKFGFFIEVEKISEFLIVKFDKRAKNKEFFFRRGLCLEKNLLEAPGYDSTIRLRLEISHHSVGLARTGLTIGKNGAIVSLNDLINKLNSNRLVNLLLRWVSIKYIIKGENLIFPFIAIDILNEQLIFFQIKIEIFGKVCVKKSVLLVVSFSLKGLERTITFTVYSDMGCK